MSLPLYDLNMRAETLANTRKECLSLRAKGAEGGKSKWDEIEAMRPTRAGMLIPLALLNGRKSRGSVSPSTSGGRHTYKVNTAMGVTAPGVEEDVSRPISARILDVFMFHSSWYKHCLCEHYI